MPEVEMDVHEENICDQTKKGACDPKKQKKQEKNISQIMIKQLQEATQLYCEMKRIVILDETFRQKQDSPEEKEYLEFFNRLRYNKCTDFDLQAVRARLKANITNADEIAEYSQDLHIYPFCEMVRKRNR